MFKRILFSAGVLTVFILGAYAQESFNITPAVYAVFHTLKAMVWDLYTTFLANRLAEVNTVSAIVALGGFSALLYLKLLSRARKM
ncbi:MAG: hypothetical protein ACOY4I_07150 [Bacillota bacterium]